MPRVLHAALLTLVAGCSAANPRFGQTGDGSAGASGTQGDTGANPPLDGSDGSVSDSSVDTSVTSAGTSDTTAWVFRDAAWEGEFSDGTQTGLAWFGQFLALAEPRLRTGEHVSRVYSPGTEGVLTSIAWKPSAPYGKPLPNDGAIESGYDRGNVDMSDNVLLLHLDRPDPLVDRMVVPDSSGHGHDGVAFGAGGDNVSFDVTDGVFAVGVRDSQPDDYIGFAAQGLAPGEGDFTWAMWVRNSDCEQNMTWLAMDSVENLPNTALVWIGCAPCQKGIGGRGVSFGIRDGSSGAVACVRSDLDYDEWQHVALVKQGHRSFIARLFVNGEAIYSEDGTLTGSLDAGPTMAVLLGGGPDTSFPSVGDYDEVAMWQRALSDEEVKNLFVRGSARLRLQVRTCQEPACADDPEFVGPDGDPELVFRDPPEALGPGTLLPLPPLTGAYVQYRAELGSRYGGAIPELWDVTVTGEQP